MISASLLVFAVLIAYSNSLSGPFVFDDFNSIVNNAQIRDWRLPLEVLSPRKNSAIAGRPLVSMSLALNYAAGGLEVRGYHLWNVGVHVVCVLLVFGIVRRTLELPAVGPALGRLAQNLAFWIALIWALHPINTEAVDYIVQRTESMAALFCLATIYAARRALESRSAIRWQAAAVTSCALGMACKESMAVTPILVIGYDSAYVFGGIRRAIATRWRLYLGLATSWLLLAALAWSGPRSRTAGFSNEDGVTSWTYLLNQTVMVTQYLRRTVWPDTLVINYGFPRLVTLGAVAPEAVFVAFLLALTIIGWRVRPTIGFLGVWFFLTLAPASSIVPIATEVGAERRMYLPLVSVVALAVAGVFFLVKRMEERWLRAPTIGSRNVRRAAIALLATIAVALGARTLRRNRDYQSTLTLAREAVAGWPTGETHDLFATALLLSGAHQEGLAQLRAALPLVPRVHYRLGMELLNDGNYDDGFEHLRKVIELGTSPPSGFLPSELPSPSNVASARQFIGRSLAGQGRWGEAAEQFQLILSADPANVQAHRLLADAMFAQQRFAEALDHYRTFLSSEPNNADALGRFGVALLASGRMDDAIAAFRRAATADPKSAIAERNLANALFDRGNYGEAAVHARQAVALDPDDSGSREVMQRALTAERQPGKAIDRAPAGR